MKKVLLFALAMATVVLMTACNEKEKEKVPTNNEPEQTVVETTPTENVEQTQENNEETPTTVEESGEEQVGVGNTDEGMVALVLEQYYLDNYYGIVEEFVAKNIKVYSHEEAAADPALSGYTINEGDIPFEAEYELKIVEGYEDMNSFTAGTGEIDGQWIRNKYSVGIVRNDGEEGFHIEAFGTAF